jgi:DNA ligase (NAD+)
MPNLKQVLEQKVLMSFLKFNVLKEKKRATIVGSTIASGVSKNLNILVVGEKVGSKLKKAQDLGSVEILSEQEFLDKLG